MISENITSLKRYYENGDDNIGKQFVQPCLQECIRYRRGTAYFKSSSLIAYASALHHVIKDNVKIEILCSPALDQDKILLRIWEGNITEEEKLKTLQRLGEEIIWKAVKYQKDPEKSIRERADILAYLIANEQLEIKIAVKKDNDWPHPWPTEDEIDNFSNLYHVKRGYFVFEDGKQIAFNGSFNETASGHKHNTEEVNVIKVWRDGDDKKRGEDIIKRVDRDWNEENKNLYIRPLSKELIEKIRESAPDKKPEKMKKSGIVVPPNPNDKIKLWPHQEKAIKEWELNGNQGILTMATGSGKTITAISAIKKLRERDKGSLVQIVVPLRSLAMQWIEGLSEFGLKTLLVSSDNSGWETNIQDELMNIAIKGKSYKGPVIVIVENSFKMKKFQNFLTKFSEPEELDKLIIVDECHHFNKKEIVKILPKFFNLRMGLSATPFNRFDIENEKLFLLEYFQKEVFKYTLEDAIRDEFLTPYNYHVIPVTLDEIESKELQDINKKIAIAIRNDDEEMRNKLSGQKTRLLASVKDKLIQLENLIKGKKRDYALAYCGAAQEDDLNDDGEKIRIINKVTSIFTKNNWQVGRITADETMKERQIAIDDLEHKIKNVIVSIKVLDEGIDIPCCQTAYILSSSKDDKQFIQRRGRVLRMHKASDKKLADIYDFAILDGTSSDAIQSLKNDEFYRINEFAKSALNKNEIFEKYKEELKAYE